jgi:hypothetical protein
LEEVYEFDKQNRMKYHPDFHFNHGKSFTEEELEYICKYYEIDGSRTIGFALGRTENTIRTIIGKLIRSGKFAFYKNRGLYY